MTKQQQLQVCKDANDLSEKLGRLEVFLDSDESGHLLRDDYFRLQVQRDIMKAYWSILNARIMEF